MGFLDVFAHNVFVIENNNKTKTENQRFSVPREKLVLMFNLPASSQTSNTKGPGPVDIWLFLN